MRLNERYLLSTGAAYAITTLVLSLFNETRLDLYVSLYIIEYFIMTLLHSPLKPKTNRVLDLTGYALFAVFLVIVASRVTEILFGFRIL